MNQEFTNSKLRPDHSDTPAKNGLTPEHTLRLLAAVKPPEGLADRVHYRLARAQKEPVQRGIWQSLMPMRRLQYAGAAALAVAVAGSMWGVYHTHHSIVPAKTLLQGASSGASGTASGVQGTGSGVQGTGSGAFRSAGTERRPATLTPIRVPESKIAPLQKKKPSASRAKPITKSAGPASSAAPTVPVIVQ